MVTGSATDIVPNGTPVPVQASAGIKATVVFLSAKTGNGADIRFGDANVSATRGARIPAGQTIVLPRVSFDQGGYDLSNLYVFGAGGSDSVSVSWAV